MEDHDHSHRLPGRVPNGGGAVFDRGFRAVLRLQRRVIREADDDALPQDLAHRILRGLAGIFVDDLEDLFILCESDITSKQAARVARYLQNYEVVKQKLSLVKGRKAIILLTDGKDAGSYTTKSTLLNQLEESDTLVYSIFYDTTKDRPIFQPNNFPFPNRGGGMGGMGGGMGRNGGGMGRNGGGFPGGGGQQQARFPPNGGNNRQGRSPEEIKKRDEMSNQKAIEFLQQLSTATAGRFYEKDVTDLTTAFTSIADELRKQYLLGYYPENVEDGRLYQIKVKVDQTGAVVRSKSTYRIKGN